MLYIYFIYRLESSPCKYCLESMMLQVRLFLLSNLFGKSLILASEFALNLACKDNNYLCLFGITEPEKRQRIYVLWDEKQETRCVVALGLSNIEVFYQFYLQDT